jgi:deoxyribose-phosphate aldolase
MIDISAVQASHGEKEVRELVDYAQMYHFGAVHVLPCWVKLIKELLPEGSSTLIGSPVGFPSGAHKKVVKILEARELIEDGVSELDIMINISMLRSGYYDYVEDEIKSLIGIAGRIPVKVLLETYYLTEDEIKKACELSIKGGAAYVKTSTGWAPSGASREVISLITSFVGKSIKVKASGGIRCLADFVDLYKMGVSRFGINLKASIDIIKECEALPGGVIDLVQGEE